MGPGKPPRSSLKKPSSNGPPEVQPQRRLLEKEKRNGKVGKVMENGEVYTMYINIYLHLI